MCECVSACVRACVRACVCVQLISWGWGFFFLGGQCGCTKCTFLLSLSTNVVRLPPACILDDLRLEVGNFFDGDFSDAEGRTNFALWSLMKSPLILGTDLTNMTTTTLATITAPLAISVNQDSLGEQGILRQSSCNFFKKPVKGVYATPCGTQVWTGALSKSRATAALVNMESTSQTITLTNSVLPSHRRQGSEVADRAVKWHIVDAFSGSTFCKACKLPASVHVAAHDVAFWVLTRA